MASMARVTPLHSKKAVRRAGERIGKRLGTAAELEQAREMVGNFRSAHGYPLLAVTVNARARALAVSDDAIVARRLKRLPTIMDKLERYPDMNVTTMQDLGGCRVVFESVEDVEELVEALRSSKRTQNQIVRYYDYIREDPGPKTSGYRGVHLVYEYRASQQAFHGLRVELQVRTALQHAWATAVETMDLFSNSGLKYGRADTDLERFFVVASSLMAVEEKTTLVPGATGSLAALETELRSLETKVGAISRLEGYNAIVSQHAHSNRRSALTLELKRREQELTVTVHERIADAERRLAELEARDDDNLDAVLVNVSQIGQLESAYPNYYANSTAFTEFLRGHL